MWMGKSMAWTFRRLRSDGKQGQVEVAEVASTKLVKEVGNFLGEVAQLAQLAEQQRQ